MDVNIIDGIIIGVILFFAIRSFIRGIIREVLGLVSLAGSVYLSLYTYEMLIPTYEPYIESPTVLEGACIASAFILYMIMFTIVSYTVSRMINTSAIGSINQSLGFVFGIFKGILFVSIAYAAIASVTKDRMPDILKHAHLEPFLRQSAHVISTTFPKPLKANIMQTLKNVHTTVISPSLGQDTAPPSTQ